MNYKSGIVLCCVLTIASNQAALADSEDKSEEIGSDHAAKQQNETLAMNSGPPDSHEAMNNREISLDLRNKRSYSFLLGLINNNSVYEVTKSESEKKLEQISQDENSYASELLLELLVKIASNPEQWKKVHQLLENINNDLIASKKLVDDLQPHRDPNVKEDSSNIPIDKKMKLENDTRSNEWPTFQVANPSFVNTDLPDPKTYPKTFAYHRVTGRPLYIDKNPKAYIAVSVIAPKPLSSRSKEEDLLLEKQLRQLKPWTHKGNLKNMASIRSRWVIQKSDDKEHAP